MMILKLDSPYRVVYDVQDLWLPHWSSQWIIAGGFILLALILILKVHHGFIRNVLAGFFIFVALAIVGLDYWTTIRLRRALTQKHYTLVEGIVRNFTPGDPGAHTAERWDIESGGRTYHYEYHQSSYHPGFATTQPYGGPIREGLHVRIADVDGVIARLELNP